jgi:acetylornithine/succinyldiaminopimelate/putrescine aminotransferase
MKLKTAEHKYFGRERETHDIQIARSNGSFLYDTDGNRYIDFFMGWCVGNMGWGNDEIKDIIRNFDGPDYIYPGLKYEPWVELAELLAEIAPGKLQKSYRASGGSEANEAALQMAMLYTGRRKFLSIEDSYHGNTLATLSIASSSNREKFDNLLPGCYKIDLPLNEKALGKVETKLKSKEIAAFIMEPVICNLGAYVPETEFMTGLRDLCTKYGTLLIFDEVACGFGRTGKIFASEHYDAEPDIMTVSKAITGGYAGMGATIATDDVAAKIKDDFEFYSTYGWHPLSTAVAIANVKYLINNRDQFLDHVNEIGQLFMNRLGEIDFRDDVKIQGKGLAIGVELEDAKKAEKIRKKCREKGLLISVEEKTLQFFPALNIDEETAYEGLDILQECL